MNDKTLLELAAKAAGIEIYTQVGNTILYKIGKYLGHWNPLTSNDDALRLAVKLDMGIEVMKALKEVRVGDGCGEIITERYSDDPYAATRRAIVRAAAEIGKAA